jgi:signal transduction histidine kinase
VNHKLNEDHRSFKELADSLPQIIWTARPDGFVDYYNERWYQFTGADRNGGAVENWVLHLHGEDVERAKTAWSHSVTTGEDFKLELRWREQFSQKYVWHLCVAKAAKDSDGQIVKWYGSCTDIDQQKKAEQQVVDILEGMNDSFFAIDADWNLSRVNSRMEATTQIRREDAVGKNFFLSFPMEKDSKYWINHHKIMEERVPVRYEEYYEPLDLWTEARGYPTADGGIAYLFRDISIEKRALQKLEALTRELQEAVRIRDEFISIASHELRTPITSLKMQLQMLERSIDSAKGEALPIDKLAKRIHGSNIQVSRLTNLIEGLLDISRMNAGKMSYDFQVVDVSVLVIDVVERFKYDYLQGDRKIHLDVQDDLQLNCDPLRIEQVLINLLSNAMKYGNEEDVRVSLHGSADGINLSVQDKGIGIKKEKHEQIFNRFERLVPHTNISGMGLGLYIVKQIVDGHHGRITVESEEGMGSSFQVFLPWVRLNKSASDH